MNAPKVSASDLRDMLVRRAFELNILLRAASLRGVPVLVDMVERHNDAHPRGYTEIHVQTETGHYP